MKGTSGGERREQLTGAVVGVVVDDYPFVRGAGLGRHRRHHPLEVGGLVANRGDDEEPLLC